MICSKPYPAVPLEWEMQSCLYLHVSLSVYGSSIHIRLNSGGPCQMLQQCSGSFYFLEKNECVDRQQEYQHLLELLKPRSSGQWRLRGIDGSIRFSRQLTHINNTAHWNPDSFLFFYFSNERVMGKFLRNWNARGKVGQFNGNIVWVTMNDNLISSFHWFFSHLFMIQPERCQI